MYIMHTKGPAAPLRVAGVVLMKSSVVAGTVCTHWDRGLHTVCPGGRRSPRGEVSLALFRKGNSPALTSLQTLFAPERERISSSL